MKYEKPVVEVIPFEENVQFMTSSAGGPETAVYK